jgi:hypothetical protein
MTICEYCGRTHQVQIPDSRFCSVFCRVQHQQFMADLEATSNQIVASYIEYVRTGADYLAQHLVALARRAAKLLEDTQQLDDKQRIFQLSYFLKDLAKGNNAAQEVCRALSIALGLELEDDQPPEW